MSISVEVWGDYACFSRPEMKVERVSYDVMTPSAARGLLEAIYWHPGMKWVVDRIHVCAPIRFTNIRRNEVKDTVSARKAQTVMEKGGELYLATPDSIQQRAAMVVRDVRYVIDAHFEMTARATPTDNPGKFQDIMRRRVEKGQFYHQPCFGVREFPGIIRGRGVHGHLKMGIDDIPHIPQHHGGPLLNAVRGCQIQVAALFHDRLRLSGTDGILDLIAPDVGEANRRTDVNPVYNPFHPWVPQNAFQQSTGSRGGYHIIANPFCFELRP